MSDGKFTALSLIQSILHFPFVQDILCCFKFTMTFSTTLLNKMFKENLAYAHLYELKTKFSTIIQLSYVIVSL